MIETVNINIVWIEINTIDGNFVIQPGYISTVFLLDTGKEVIYKLKSGKQSSLILNNGGILRVIKESSLCVLLINE